MNGWNIYWLIWFAIALCAFGVPEAIAIHRKEKGDTLSESVWSLLETGWRVPFVIVLIGTFGWLLLHFLFHF